MKVLLVEDDSTDARMVEIALSRHSSDYAVTHVGTLADALDALDGSRFDAVLVDLNLPDAKGSECIDRIMLARCTAPVIVLSGNDDEELAAHLIGAGAQDFLLKGRDGLRTLPRALRFGVERKAAELRLRHLASYDTLTNLANRQELYTQLGKACAHSERQGDMVVLLLLDLDRFKLANDTHGHEMGDAILREVGRRLERLIRTGDTAARLGGDEFAVVLEGVSDTAAAHAWAKNALERLNEPIVVNGVTSPVSASMGGSIYPTHGNDVDTLMRSADVAMYKVKEAGRNGVAFYDEQMDRTVVRHQVLESELRDALANNLIEAAFQPKVSLESGAVIGLEALSRWRRVNGDNVSPSEFIPIAQRYRLMPAVGRHIRRLAIQASKDWSKTLDMPLPISINVDAQEVAADGYADRLLADIREANIDASLISIEITESTLLEQNDTTLGNLNKLSENGIGIELDDFGAGHSSLKYLRQFPIDTIKLDRSLLEGLGSSHHDRVIVQTIVGLGKELEVAVIAEGVETRKQLRELLKLGCDAAQGFLFARPMPFDQCTNWLRSQAVRTPGRLESMTGVFEVPPEFQQPSANEDHSA